MIIKEKLKDVANASLKRLVWKIASFITLQMVIVMLVVFPLDFLVAIIRHGHLIVDSSIYMASITTYGSKSLLIAGIDSWKGNKNVDNNTENNEQSFGDK
jgi:hypothetical protein